MDGGKLMFYDVKIITDIDKELNETIEKTTIVCKTEEEINNMEEELKGINIITHEFKSIDGKIISGLEILKCYKKYK